MPNNETLDKEELKSLIKEVLNEIFQDQDAMFHLINAIEHQVMDMKEAMEKAVHEISDKIDRRY